eukprot:403360819
MENIHANHSEQMKLFNSNNSKNQQSQLYENQIYSSNNYEGEQANGLLNQTSLNSSQNRINFQKFMKQKPIPPQGPINQPTTGRAGKDQFQNKDFSFSQANSPNLISPRYVMEEMANNLTSSVGSVEQIKHLRNHEKLNRSSEKLSIDRQRNVITNMIANSRSGMPSLFKHEFYDGGKQQELEKILHKKLREKAKTTKKSKKDFKNHDFTSTLTQRHGSLDHNRSGQIPQIYLDKVAMKNLELKLEQEKFNVLKNDNILISEDYTLSGSKISHQPLLNLKSQTLHKKLVDIDKTKRSYQSQTERVSKQGQYNSNKKKDNKEFMSNIDSIMTDFNYLRGIKEVTDNQSQLERKAANSSSISVYKQDFDVKMSKMEKHFDNHLTTIGETIDSVEKTLINREKKMKSIIQSQGKLSPYRARAGGKSKPSDINLNFHEKGAATSKNQKTQLAFMQKVPLLQSNVDDNDEISSYQVDKIGGVDIKTPMSYNSLPQNPFTVSIYKHKQHEPKHQDFERHKDDMMSGSDYLNKMFQQTQMTNSTKYNWDNGNKVNQSIINQKDGDEFDFSRNMLDLKEIQQNSKINDQELNNIISELLDINIRNEKDTGLESKLSIHLSEFDQYTNQSNQTFARIAREIQSKNIFNKLCKNYISPKIMDEFAQDSTLNFFIECQKELVLALPILQKIRKRTLNLTGYGLNQGHSKALQIAFKYFENILGKIHLENNNLKDDDFREILDGLAQLQDLKSIIYKNNEFGVKSAERLRPMLIKMLNDRCYIRKLALVNAGLNDQSIKILVDFLKSSRLTDLDISWNGLKPQNLLDFIQTIGENRQLSYLNIAWNNIIEKSGINSDKIQGDDNKRKSQQDASQIIKNAVSQEIKLKNTKSTDVNTKIMISLSNFIKYNKNLLHLDISNTGMTQPMLWSLGTALRRSRSLVSIHLSGNPGVTEQLKEYLHQRSPRQQYIEEGVQLKQVFQQKKQQNTHFEQDNQAQSENKKLIIQRFLGHKRDIKLSGQWQMLTDPLHDHCWVCDKWTYSLIFWTTQYGYDQSVEVDMLEKEKIEEQIRMINQNEIYDEESSKVPKICGSFTNWKYMQFLKIEDFCAILDQNPPDFLKWMRDRKLLNKDIKSEDKLNSVQRKQFEEFVIENRKSYYKKIFKEVIEKNLLYRKPFIQNPSCFENYSDTSHQQLYVYPVFMRSGKHSYMIENIDQETFMHKLIAPFREEDIPIFVKTSKIKVFQRVFKKDTSVFKDWKEDTASSYLKCGEHDQKFWKIPRFVKDPIEQQLCFDLVQANFKHLKNIFISLACKSSFPNISWIDFTTFCESCKILDKNVVLSTIDRLFIATNVEIEQQSDNPDKSLCRYEFFEILVRLSNSKYKEPGIIATHSESFKKLLYEHILPFAVVYPWQEFRDNQIWKIEVNDTLEANLEGLKKVYAKYFDPRKKYMTMQDALSLMMKDTNIGLIEKDAIFCYGMCKMTCVNEQQDSTVHYKRLQFVEMLELICRIADLKFKNIEADKMSLIQKIELVLDDVLALAEVKRKDVNIKVDDISESDDDY